VGGADRGERGEGVEGAGPVRRPAAERESGRPRRGGTSYLVGVAPDRIEVVTSIEGIGFAAAWKRRETGSYGGEPFPVLGPDDVVRRRSADGRPRDLTAVRKLARVKPKRQAKRRR